MKFRPIIGKLPGHRQFDYEPRFYKPEKEKYRHHIHIERKTRRGQVRSVMVYAVLLFLVFWIILHL